MEQFQDLLGWVFGLVSGSVIVLVSIYRWLRSEFVHRDNKIGELDKKVTAQGASMIKEFALIRQESAAQAEEMRAQMAENNQRFTEELAKVHTEIALNRQQDASNQNAVMQEIRVIAKEVNGVVTQMKVWQQNIENFYYKNPTINKPDA
jgi:hypothetical protein